MEINKNNLSYALLLILIPSISFSNIERDFNENQKIKTQALAPHPMNFDHVTLQIDREETGQKEEIRIKEVNAGRWIPAGLLFSGIFFWSIIFSLVFQNIYIAINTAIVILVVILLWSIYLSFK